VQDYLPFIRAGMQVLDVGCGTWPLIRDHCHQVGAHYEAIDVRSEYFGVKTIATRLENLADLSFPDNSFDRVIGNQSMEHWDEHGCSLYWGLYQCFRVCNPQGRVCLNVPIHFHGTQPFLLGHITYLKQLFLPFSTQVSFEVWGHPSQPLPALFPWPGYWMLRDKPAYVLDIQAIKDRPLPSGGYHNQWATQGMLARILHNPVSFLVYRAARKAGFFPRDMLKKDGKDGA
jgi:SAM-dependent methyltransferase